MTERDYRHDALAGLSEHDLQQFQRFSVCCLCYCFCSKSSSLCCFNQVLIKQKESLKNKVYLGVLLSKLGDLV